VKGAGRLILINRRENSGVETGIFVQTTGKAFNAPTTNGRIPAHRELG
jgi:hypothetical protein